jgi:pimeloyl-ACP methyl ester carboxylesterase
LSSEKSTKKISQRIFHKARFGIDKFILVRRSKIHYVEAGQGEPVILIPGSYNTQRTWKRIMPLLAAEFRLLALDYIGTTDSGKQPEIPEFTLQEQTDIIAKMVRQIGLPKVNLIGGYYGGAAVYDFAARYPELVLKIISIEGSLISSDLNNPVPDVLSQAKNSFRVPWYKINIGRKSTFNLEEEAKSIKAPLLYLFGTKSDIKRIQLVQNLEFLKTYLPHAWVVALEGSIHDLNTQQPQDIANILLEFLRKNLAPRG